MDMFQIPIKWFKRYRKAPDLTYSTAPTITIRCIECGRLIQAAFFVGAEEKDLRCYCGGEVVRVGAG